MNHEEFLIYLIRGFSADPQIDREPSQSGATEADAVARWMAYEVALFSMSDCDFVPTRTGWLVQVTGIRTWSRWDPSERENVDMTLSGYNLPDQSGPIIQNRIKVDVAPGAGENRYFLRLTDWRTRTHIDIDGVGETLSNNRLIIRNQGNPIRFPVPELRQRARAERVRLRRCCRTSMQQIGRIVGRFELYRNAVDARDTPWWHDPLGSLDPTNHGNSAAPVLEQLSPIQHREVNRIITTELMNHGSNYPLRRHWEMMAETHAE